MNVIIKKYGTTHALWFSQSKSFLLLEEPAFDVFKLQQDKVKRQEIVDFCQDKYGHLEEHIAEFVDETCELLNHYQSTGTVVSMSQKAYFDDDIQPGVSIDSKVYKIGSKIIRINYGHRNLLHAIHPLQAHLEISDDMKAEHVIDCFLEGDILICKHNGKLVEAFKTDAVEYFTGNVRQLEYSIVYDKEFYDWMGMLHASGIVKDHRAVLFSAAAGSGKTTVSALLKAHGYDYLSDDFIAVDKAGNAYPFPAAISVKEGSIEVLSEYYSELKATSPEHTFIGKTVRYIPVFNLNENKEHGTPVIAFVFVQFSAAEDFVFKPVEKSEALKLLLQETWVNPTPEFVNRFFHWIDEIRFYRLRYSKTDEALSAVDEIFGDKPKPQ